MNKTRKRLKQLFRATRRVNLARVTSPSADFSLDRDQVRRGKAARDYRLNAAQIPLLRLLGLLSLYLIVVLWNLYAGAPFEPGRHLALGLTLLGYGLLSWLLLVRYYRRSRRLHLGFLFLNIDVLFYLLAIDQASGNPLPLALGVLLSRVADQVGVGFRRALYFSHLVSVAFGAFLLYRYAIHQPVD